MHTNILISIALIITIIVLAYSIFVIKNDSKEYILCSAIKRIEPTHIDEEYNDTHMCVLGYRHSDILHNYYGLVLKGLSAQGFFTSKGRFVDRKEAYKIALSANQIHSTNVSGVLYSEDLY